MFDPAWLTSDRPSAVEEALRAALAGYRSTPTITLVRPPRHIEIDYRPHGRPHPVTPPADPSPPGVAAPAGTSPPSPGEGGPVGRLLARGASVLDVAAGQQAAVDVALAARTRALAAFARWRPAAALDRQPGEVGAASAATRAACPRVLAQ